MSEFHGSGSFTLSRPSMGSWHHKKSNLYKEQLLEVTNSLKINADDFNAAADAAVDKIQAPVTDISVNSCASSTVTVFTCQSALAGTARCPPDSRHWGHKLPLFSLASKHQS